MSVSAFICELIVIFVETNTDRDASVINEFVCWIGIFFSNDISFIYRFLIMK